ncbi:hypothetical protein [Pseudomonas alabamensis]|uniref:hypothetical protein n=1 Tax=Pseudomonas alabamensis TaxID=3064349 RepID=UPI003F64A408
MKIKAITSGEAAHILRLKLGAGRAWNDLLADMRRGKSTYFGLVLTPFLISHDGVGMRPFYKVGDVRDFIVEALKVAPPLVKGIQVREFNVDPSDKRHWRVREVF